MLLLRSALKLEIRIEQISDFQVKANVCANAVALGTQSKCGRNMIMLKLSFTFLFLLLLVILE